MPEDRRGFIARQPFTVLLAGLVVLMLVGPFVSDSPVSHYINRVMVTLVLLAAIYTIIGSRKTMIGAMLLFVVTVVTTWITAFVTPISLVVADHITTLVFLGLFIVTTARKIVRTSSVDPEAIRGAICIYLLLGFAFAVVYSLIEYLDPGALVIDEAHGVEARDCLLGGARFHYMIYYSFVTQTTLGYGDINPVSEPAQAIAVFQACAGQLYLAVTIARLVAMELSERRAQDG